jgi:uncharacterized protein (TIGR03435 family)
LYRYDKAALLDLIARAWHVEYFQVLSASPLDHQTFDLTARIPAGATKEQFRVMLQNLLAERFGLKMHMESREFPAYELVVEKSGLKLKEAVPGTPPRTAPKSNTDLAWPELPPTGSHIAAQMSSLGGYELDRVVIQMEPLSAFAQLLPRPDRLPIVDKTGLTGRYSFAIEYTQDPQGSEPDAPQPAPDVFTALKQQLGLELIRKKLPFDVVVVESFNKIPTEN